MTVTQHGDIPDVFPCIDLHGISFNRSRKSNTVKIEAQLRNGCRPPACGARLPLRSPGPIGEDRERRLSHSRGAYGGSGEKHPIGGFPDGDGTGAPAFAPDVRSGFEVNMGRTTGAALDSTESDR